MPGGLADDGGPHGARCKCEVRSLFRLDGAQCRATSRTCRSPVPGRAWPRSVPSHLGIPRPSLGFPLPPCICGPETFTASLSDRPWHDGRIQGTIYTGQAGRSPLSLPSNRPPDSQTAAVSPRRPDEQRAWSTSLCACPNHGESPAQKPDLFALRPVEGNHAP
ncbi:hypothetical protein VUR80DRAFT_3107 [Thermomyces stellatus]